MSPPTASTSKRVATRLAKSGLVGITVAALPLAVVGIYASDPAHWTSISWPWSLTGYALFFGVVAALTHALHTCYEDFLSVTESLRQLAGEHERILKSAGIVLPRVVRSLVAVSTGMERVTLLVEPSPLFGVGLAASIYTMIDGFEILLGEGRTVVVQQGGGAIQILVTAKKEGYEQVWQAINENSPDRLKVIFVRPGNQSYE